MSTTTRRVSAASGAAALLAAVGGAIGYYASRILQPPVDIPPRRPRPGDLVTVADVTDTGVVLEGPGAAVPGIWGLSWDDGYGRIGPPTTADDGLVARPFELLVGTLEAGTPALLDPFAATPDPAHAEVEARRVTYDGPLGPTPAVWFPAASPDTWAIHVHGRSTRYDEGFRLAPALVRMGVNALAVAYRDDPDGPRSPDGRSHLGATEWADVDAAIGFAADHGARHVVLIGYSMGGGIAATCVRRSEHAELVRGLILDAPVLDWEPVMRRVARSRGLPAAVLPILLPASMALAGLRAGIDWRALRHDPESITVPTLLIHGDEDDTVPVELARALAGARPDLVTYLEVAGAGHCRGWNHDPAAYEAAVSTFLDAHVPAHAPEPR